MERDYAYGTKNEDLIKIYENSRKITPYFESETPKYRKMNSKRTWDQLDDQEKQAVRTLCGLEEEDMEAITILTNMENAENSQNNEEIRVNYKVTGIRLNQNNAWEFKIKYIKAKGSGEIIKTEEKWLKREYLMTQIPKLVVDFVIEKVPAMISNIQQPVIPINP
jgi:hypothetical protein